MRRALGSSLSVLLLAALALVSCWPGAQAFLLPQGPPAARRAVGKPMARTAAVVRTPTATPSTRLWSTVGSPSAAATERFEALVQELLAAEDLPTLALERADNYDYHFMSHLMQRVNAATSQEEIAALNRVGEAVNFAMQQKLAKADFILRGILKAGDLKVMEAKMRKHLRAGELDMAFDVILNMNAQQAKVTEGNESAANILQHLATILSEERDKKLPAETRLLRMLLRTEKAEERVAMLLEKLLLRNPPPRPKVRNEETGEEEDYEPFWGQPEVEPEALKAAIGGFLEEVQAFAHELDTDVLDRAKALQGELEAIAKACN